MKNTKKLAIVICLALAVIGGIFYHSGYGKDNSKETGFKLLGNVEMRQVLLSFRVPGRLTELLVEEGEKVKAGDLLAVIDDKTYRASCAEAEAALALNKANLEKLQNGYRPKEIGQAAANLNEVKASLELAERDFVRLDNLYKEKAISKKQLDDATAKRNQLRARQQSLSNELGIYKEGYRKEDIKAAEANVNISEAKLQTAKIAFNDTKLYAPSDGVIITRITEPGTMVSAGQSAYSMYQTTPILVRAFISETQLGKVWVGMKAKVYMDAYPGEPIDAAVNFISQTSEFTPKQVQTEDMRLNLVYRIKLLVPENPQDRLKNGMPVSILLEEGK